MIDLLMTKPVLAVAMVVIVTACMWVLVHNRKRYLFSMLFIPIMLLTATSVYFSVRSYEGWPVKKSPGSNFTLHWYVIDESKPTVYLWVTVAGGDKPRAYRIPYTQVTHGNLDKIRKRLNRGDTEVKGFEEHSETDDATDKQNYKFELIEPRDEKGGATPPSPRPRPAPPSHQKFT